MSNDGKILFNEKCSICNFEIKHYKKRSKLIFNDCSHMEDKYLKKLHVVFEDNRELVGVDAFIYIWKRTKGYEWLGKFVELPIIKQIAIFTYSILAFLLFWRFKIFSRS
jgi:predicted DCC family thiol-disulfide oxidoreductase YuxK|tara:strand:+ start:1509 stop:1835 length:327 start_codon:yes stop_codon:yes gene_type:complete